MFPVRSIRIRFNIKFKFCLPLDETNGLNEPAHEIMVLIT